MKKIIVILLCLCQSSWGTITLVHSTVQGGFTASLTIPSTIAGNFLVVACICDATPCTGIMDNATGGTNTYIDIPLARSTYTATGPFPESIYYSQTIHNGATSVTCVGGSADLVSVYEYSGVLASGNPVDVSSGTTGQLCSGTSCLGGKITTTNAGDVIFGTGDQGQQWTAITSPWTDGIFSGVTGQAAADYIPGVIVTSNQANWTDNTSGDHYASSTVAFLPASPTKMMSPICKNELHL